MDKHLIPAAKRAIEMLRIAGPLAEKHAFDVVTFYDDAECDGSCVAEDCRDAADSLENLIEQAARTVAGGTP